MAEAADWQRTELAREQFVISGTEARSNPLKQRLDAPVDANEIFVRYRLRYDGRTLDTPPNDEGEFFVLWLDDVDGGNANNHSGGVPNIGVHVSGSKNRFMVRYASNVERYAAELQGDREFLLVARLWKSNPGPKQPFDQLDLWVNPAAHAEKSPDASTQSARAIHRVSWIGFSTGRKTEPEDRIVVGDIKLAKTWHEILDLPAPIVLPPAMAESAIHPTVSFHNDIMPLLEARCFACHSGDEPDSGVRLDVWDEVINQTTPRNAHASRLFDVVKTGEMPPDESLSDAELHTLQAWIDEGVAWDEDELPTPTPKSTHWAFQPIQRPSVPTVQNTNWVRTPVDAFIARRHEQLGIQPAPEASPEILARRLTLDLTGLPPSSFATTMTVDDLLAHPAYGERWGRHWLDVARWAESNGHQHNRDRPHAWRYRDWVVKAFNTNMPFDRFVREQLAGDELANEGNDKIVATGFLSAARYSGNELDKEIQRNDILVDITNTTAKAFLGLTMECCQCHTHKFDPISIRDYYRFQAFFAKGQPGNVVLVEDESTRTLIDERWQIFNAVHDRLVNVKRKQGHPEPIYILPKNVVKAMKPAEKSRFQQLEQQIAKFPQSWSFYPYVSGATQLAVAPHEMRWPLPHKPATPGSVRTHMLIRGDVKSKGPRVQAGWPAVFGPTPDDVSGSRLRLADWMTDAEHPLTARVWANRIWQWHFGRGLVETSGDFGTQGTEPSHPELLDYLASELIESGWDTNHLHRLIVNSSTYRQSSTISEANVAIDPENHAIWRWTPRRLESEAIRDSILAASGLLDRQAGGPSVPASSTRRSLYLRQKRNSFPAQQTLFDGATALVSCTRRETSTTPIQPLWLLNSSFAQEAASALAKRAGSVATAFEICFGRTPQTTELQPLQELADEYGLSSACLALLNSSEFLYIP
ncbi:PSD1 and planctomycete cytochrome C domain-containing protein [Thalassoroseus pseudoceratinae]|uniref:PSD1 and planctomycete cytochrome C domain-containing protein n=1 Tax=Thalassoroseus pseudoceratinae TaxID=2713176 RepID=UPI00141FE8BA|nr:PSD1 and planctomycete cytochrome C domain-containing protein [Thalassoroseus pseudoceratinae]